MKRSTWAVLVFVLWATPLLAQTSFQGVVQWTHDGANLTGFDIERKQVTGPAGVRATDTYTPIGTTNAAARVYQDPTLLAAGTYCYRVRGFNGATKGPYSEGCATATPAPTAPNAPGSVIITITPGAR